MRRAFIIVLILGIFLFGCIQSSAKLGCCLKQNATDDEKCALYNITSSRIEDLYPKTISCNVTDGYCNVTISTGKNVMIPICTDDDPMKCLAPDCQAMVCGDFKYAPRIPPGYASEDEFDEGAPVPEDEDVAVGLYGAQCRFFPVDNKLGGIMKKSSAHLNRFRFGVGGSFDEYDLYKSYFPMSDKFCSLNDYGFVDRYMNYIGSDLDEFKAYAEITDNCVDDSDILPPFTFGSPAYKTDTLPEKSSYKHQDYVKEVREQTGLESFDSAKDFDKYKKLDKDWYAEQFYIQHAGEFYSEAAPRADFECDMQGYDCLSGICSTQDYSRGVNIIAGAGGIEIEVPTDCHYLDGPSGTKELVCFPTRYPITPSSVKGNPPAISYAGVTVRPWRFNYYLSRNVDEKEISQNPTPGDPTCGGKSCSDYGMGDDCRCRLTREYFQMFGANDYQYGKSGFYTWFGNYSQINNIPTDWGFIPSESNAGKLGSYINSEAAYPPASSIWFFGRDDIVYDGETIMGMAVIDRSELEQTYFGKYCGLFAGAETEYVYYSTSEFGLTAGDLTSCINTCKDSDHCGFTYEPECKAYCEQRIYQDPIDSKWKYNDSYIPSCNYTPTYVGAQSPYLIEVNLDKESDIKKLMESFYPYFESRMDSYVGSWSKDGCGSVADDEELIISSLPFIPAYKKYNENGDLMVKGTGTPGNYAYLKHNLYDKNDNNLVGVDSCSLRSHTQAYGGYHNDFFGNDLPFFYEILLPKQVYLIKGNLTTNMLGTCKIVPNTNTPKIKTFGWCEPCTLSTFAYQTVTAQNSPYLPTLEKSVGGAYSSTLCEIKTEKSSEDGVSITSTTSSCYAPHITDIGDYSGIGKVDKRWWSLGTYHSSTEYVGTLPRTVPEATLMKERLGTYLQSGVMPVLDLSDESNWNLTSPYLTGFTITSLFSFSIENSFKQYDFERLLGNSGAIVVVVDKADSAANSTRIMQRANLIRTHCKRCLTAVQIEASGKTDYEKNLERAFSHPFVKNSIDIVTFSYANSLGPDPYLSDASKFGIMTTPAGAYGPGMNDYDKADAVVDDILAISQMSLEKYGKPAIATQFFVAPDSHWKDSNYEILFTRIIERENDLVKAGLLGMIYSPVRSGKFTFPFVGTIDSKWGIVEEQGGLGGIGIKGEKFCALERATGLLGTTRDYASFTKQIAEAYVNCTRCNSIEITMGLCNTTCDNGNSCLVPEKEDPALYKCPADSVVEPCIQCDQYIGEIICNKTFVNGTVEKYKVEAQYVISDAYSEEIGALKKPNKCCLQDNSGINYTFIKRTLSDIRNAPIIYPKSGDQSIDCGLTTGSSLEQVGDFCGAKIPIVNYDLECELLSSGIKAPPEYVAIIPKDTGIGPMMPGLPLQTT